MEKTLILKGETKTLRSFEMMAKQLGKRRQRFT